MTAPAHNAFASPNFPTWCPGCGNFGIWTALKQALAELNIELHRTVIVFGIGCSGNESNFVKAYGFHGLHGRTLPVAEGVALANSGLTTIAIGGDGDGYGEGMAHFIHTIRANPNITYIVHDNQVYGLTKGQTSPTSEHGFKTPSTPLGNPDLPINPISLAIAAGAGFVARGFAGDAGHLTGLIKAAIQHRGFSLVDVFQPCVTFNATNTFRWFFGKVVKLETLKHDPTNRDTAWKQAQNEEKLPIGVFYQKESPTLQDGFPVLAKKTLVEQSPEKRQIRPLLEKMK
ncbi:MAG: 2-oxoacid:ferredoxin oxidoreductase subunit beta [Patescibacteria group bacterium]